MKRIILIILLATVFIEADFAQVNTEKYRNPEETSGFSGFVEINASVKTGNTEKTELGFDGRTNYKTGNTLSFLIIQEDYEWVGGSRSSDKGLIHLRHVRSFAGPVKIEFFGQVNYDKKILLTNREILGAGFRYELFKFDNSDIHIGTSYMFEHENYDLPAGALHPSEQKVSRWSNYLTYYLTINETVQLGSVLYYQPVFVDFKDYRILNENSLNVSLTKSFVLSVNFRLRYDSKSPAAVKNTDTETKIGIGVRF